MPSTAEILRKACAANGLGVSGSAATLFARLVNSGNSKGSKCNTNKACATKRNKPPPKKKQNVSKSKLIAKKPKYTSAFKTVKNGNGSRLSASHYFHNVCDGKITRCEPQKIKQSDGRARWKEIRIVNGAHGKHPRWVLVQ